MPEGLYPASMTLLTLDALHWYMLLRFSQPLEKAVTSFIESTGFQNPVTKKAAIATMTRTAMAIITMIFTGSSMPFFMFINGF